MNILIRNFILVSLLLLSFPIPPENSQDNCAVTYFCLNLQFPIFTRNHVVNIRKNVRAAKTIM
jgi:hypothetical protein